MKDLIKKGVQLAEDEIQEKQISEVKNIVKKYLTEINDLEKEKKEIDEELSILKKDLNDIKSGRLDKIEERQKLDPRAKEISLIVLQPVNIFPVTPWKSTYEVRLINSYTPPAINYYGAASTTGLQLAGVNAGYTNAVYTATSNSDVLTLNGTSMQTCMSGTNFQNFAGGSYDIGGNIINL